MKTKKKAIFQQIVDWINDKIESREFVPGGELPSEKELCLKFSTSRASVRKALERLERTQIIFRKPGVGSFVRDANSPQADTLLNIGISNISYCDWYTADIFAGASAACTKMHAQLVFVDIDEYIKTKRTPLDGLIVLFGSEITNMENLDQFSASGVPVALLNRFTDQSNISYFSVDYERESEKAVNFLMTQNATNVGAIFDENDSVYALNTRIRGYENACRKLGIKPKFCKVSSPLTATSEIQSFILESGCDGLFLISQAVLNSTMEAYRTVELMTKRKLPILCFDKLTKEISAKSGISSIEMPLHEIAFSAVKHIVERQRKPQVPIARKLYDTHFVVNSTSFEVEDKMHNDFNILKNNKDKVKV